MANSPRLTMPSTSSTTLLFSTGLASAHLLTQKPANRRSLKISMLAGTVSGCFAMAPYVTMVPPGARSLARARAGLPPTQLSASLTAPSPPPPPPPVRAECEVHPRTRAGRSKPLDCASASVTTRRSSALKAAVSACVLRARTTATLGMRHFRASCRAARPTPELAPFCTNQALPRSPPALSLPALLALALALAFAFASVFPPPASGPVPASGDATNDGTKSTSIRHAVTGFTLTPATSAAASPAPSTLITSASATCRCVRHVPSPVRRGITQSPLRTELAPEPAATTSKTPSLPGTAEGEGVPRADVKAGSEA
ncbi:MAG: hypothetical protein LQ340_008114 [Diploschistes diacapsis]|nr:MAG: hypothetical protein LQ340_008114 [Diploschistes diacapsis]